MIIDLSNPAHLFLVSVAVFGMIVVTAVGSSDEGVPVIIGGIIGCVWYLCSNLVRNNYL